MIKIKDLSLEELYNKPKVTPSIEAAIIAKEDFTQIKENYCDSICKLKCKSYENVDLDHRPVDVLIIQDHNAYTDGYKDGSRLERSHRTILEELCRRNLKGLSYRTTNVLKCQLQEEDIVRNKPPTAAVLLKCSPYLKKEIEFSKPKVIISLTTNATKVLNIGKKSNYTNRGEVIGNVILTLHPKVTLMIRQNASGQMWGPDFWEVIDRDFAKAGNLARGELIVPNLDESIERHRPHILVTRSLEEVMRAVDELLALPESKILSFDTETTGLDPWASDAKLLTIQFGYRHQNGYIRSIVIPLWHRDNKAYDGYDAWNYIVPLLQGNHPKVGHYVKFDILYIYATTGIRVKKIAFDTMLVLHNLNSGIQGTYSLKTAVWDWFPDSGLGGYEDKLPNLTKMKVEEENDL